jgi:hypothetical protein
MQPQRFMEKLYFLSDSLEPMSCHLSTRPRVAHQTSPNQTPIDKRRINTIFNHFRDKPARFCDSSVLDSVNSMKTHINKLTIYTIWRGEVVKENNSFWNDDDITFDRYGNVSLQDFR